MADMTADGAAAPAPGYGTKSYRGYVLLVLTLVYGLNFIDRNLLSVIAQPVIAEFGLSDSQYGFLNGPPFALFYALMGVPLAMAADRWNRVALIALCITIWSVMAALCGFATSFLFLLFARVGVAIGEAGCTPPANSLIGDYFSPRSRAGALGIYSMGVTLGGTLSNAFGGPIATNLHGEALQSLFEGWGWQFAAQALNWPEIDGWRIAFVLIGAPGVLLGLIVRFTIKEPPRGFSDPPGAQRVEKASLTETLKELASKPTFWTMSMGAALVALVGYGLAGFQAPMAQRVHGVTPGDFALRFGVPLSIAAMFGTFIGGWLVEHLTPRWKNAVAYIPAIGVLVAIPLYEIAYFQPTARLNDVALICWALGSASHFVYIGSQYTIGQGVVSTRSRATAIAVLLVLVALIGNGLGPQIVGWMSDFFMGRQLAEHGMDGVLTNAICRGDVSGLPLDQQGVCKAAYGEGLRLSMAATALLFIPAAAFFAASALTLQKDLVAKPQ